MASVKADKPVNDTMVILLFSFIAAVQATGDFDGTKGSLGHQPIRFHKVQIIFCARV